MVFVLVEGSVVIWVGGSSSSSSSAQFVRVLGELEEGFLRIERYAVVAAIVVGKYVFVCLMVGKKIRDAFYVCGLHLNSDFSFVVTITERSSKMTSSTNKYAGLPDIVRPS